MSHLSAFDGEVVGFESVTQNRRAETASSTQTTEFSETAIPTQTNLSRDFGSMTKPEDFMPNDEQLKPALSGLNEFLRRVVPGVMEQLNQNASNSISSSDTEDDEAGLVDPAISAKLVQEVDVKTDMTTLGAGDFQSSVLSVSWSSAGNSFAVSLGQSQHESWCEHDGLIRIYTLKRSEGDKFVHNLDISEKNCVSVVKYHPSIAALLAYSTITGEVVVCNLYNSQGSFEEGMSLTSPSGCHGSRRVSSLQWADAPLANIFLTIHIQNTSRRRNAADQILLSSGSDGTVNVWQANASLKTFANVICYNINKAAVDITCLDFIRPVPLTPSEEKVANNIFVVGTSTGTLYLCKTKSPDPVKDVIDPVYEILEGHSTCVLNVAFSQQKSGIFASLSMDSELRIYDIQQISPLKIICLDGQLSCMAWLPSNPNLVVVGATAGDQLLKVVNLAAGREVQVEGFRGPGAVTCLDVGQSGSCCIAAGTTSTKVQVWELPTRSMRLVDDFWV